MLFSQNPCHNDVEVFMIITRNDACGCSRALRSYTKILSFTIEYGPRHFEKKTKGSVVIAQRRVNTSLLPSLTELAATL